MELNRELRNKPTSYGQLVVDKGGKNGVKTVSSMNVVGKTGPMHAKNETAPLSQTPYKNKLKMD